MGNYQYTIIKDSKGNIIAQGSEGWGSIPATGITIMIDLKPIKDYKKGEQGNMEKVEAFQVWYCVCPKCEEEFPFDDDEIRDNGDAELICPGCRSEFTATTI